MKTFSLVSSPSSSCVLKKYNKYKRVFFPEKDSILGATAHSHISIRLLDPFDDKWLHFSWWNFEYAICPPPKWRWVRVWRRQEGDETSIMESILLIENAHDKVWRNNIRRTMMLHREDFFFFLKWGSFTIHQYLLYTGKYS